MSKKAKEAAKWVNENPDTSIKRVQKVIPYYVLKLHQNQWIANFFKHLSPELHEQFLELKDL
ncbi:hypothetical protein KAR91_74905 [Candidatus Pacearchaeota archaeon]|nr:hypothetical protein [Candidatus Pacearchaeota archaeon]